MPFSQLPKAERIACVTLDLEEDHAGLSDDLGYEGLRILPDIVERLKSLRVPLTVFVSGNFLERQGKVLDNLRFLDFHSHGQFHPPLREAGQESIREKNMDEGIKTFQSFFKRLPLGYRAPYGIHELKDLRFLKERGIRFDSSLFPGFHVSGFHPWRSSRPRYYADLDMIEFPISSLFGLRIPYSFSYMNLLGTGPYRLFSKLGGFPNPLILNFHLHDFMHTSAAGRLSPFFKRVYGQKEFLASWTRFENWILFLKEKNLSFLTLEDVYQKHQTPRRIS